MMNDSTPDNKKQHKTKPDKVQNPDPPPDPMPNPMPGPMPDPPLNQGAPWPVLTIDYELYGRYLENSDLSDEQIREFINILWSISVSWVDLARGIHPTQQACEQNGIAFDFAELDASGVIQLEDNSTFNPIGDGAPSPERSQK